MTNPFEGPYDPDKYVDNIMRTRAQQRAYESINNPTNNTFANESTRNYNPIIDTQKTLTKQEDERQERAKLRQQYHEQRAKMGYDEYNDKSLKQIKEDVVASFDRHKVWTIRDDQEIYSAGLDIINKYREEVLHSSKLHKGEKYIVGKNNNPVLFKYQNPYWNEAKKYFDKAYNDIVDLHNSVGGWIKLYLRNNEKQNIIDIIASKIEEAENEALNAIQEYCNPHQDSKNAADDAKVQKDDEGNPVVKNGEIEMQKPMYNLDDKTGILTFTDAVNPVTFDKALEGNQLFIAANNYNEHYTIDYSKCKREDIKAKMIRKTGGATGDFYYDSSEKVYYIQGDNGKIVKATEIGIYEGITLRREEIKSYEAHKEELEMNEKSGRLDASIDGESPEKDPKLKKYVDAIPDKLKTKLKAMGNTEYRRFIIETENRLNDILKDRRKLRNELHIPPVTDDSSGILEICFISEEYERNEKFRNDNKKLGKDLYDLFKKGCGDDYDYKDDYVKYVTDRIEQKRQELDSFSPKQNFYQNAKEVPEKDRLTEKDVKSIGYGIYLLKTFIENHRNKERDSFIDNDDKLLISMLHDVEDLEFTLQNSHKKIKKEFFLSLAGPLYSTTVTNLATKWQQYMTLKTHDTGHLRNDFHAILAPNPKEKKINTLRGLGVSTFGWDGTTSFLADEAVATEEKKVKLEYTDGSTEDLFFQEQSLEFKDKAVNDCFQNLSGLYTSVEYDDSDKLKVTPNMRKIDKLYECTNGKEIAELLVSWEMLPKGWEKDDDVIEKCDNICKKLEEMEKNIENTTTAEDIKEGLRKEKLRLEQILPSKRTEEEKQELNRLNALLEDEDALNHYCEQSLDCMKKSCRYNGINSVLIINLYEIFMDKGGGCEGGVGDLVNDIKGYGTWDFSDKTMEIIQTTLITAVVSAVGTAAISGVISGIASTITATIASRFPGLVSLAQNVGKTLATIATKILDALGKVGQAALKAGTFLLEHNVPQKYFKILLGGAKNALVSNFYNGKNLITGIKLNPADLENLASLGITYIAGAIGTLGGKLGTKLEECFDKIKSDLSNIPLEDLEKMVGIDDVCEYLFKKGSGKFLSKLKKEVISDGTEDFTFNSDFNKGLAVLDDNFGPGEKREFVDLADKSMDFTVEPDVIDSEGNVLDKKSIDISDLMQCIKNIYAVRVKNPSVFNNFTSLLKNGVLKVCRGMREGEIFFKNNTSGKIRSINNLCDKNTKNLT